MWDPDTASSWFSLCLCPPHPASQRQWQTTPVSYRWFFQNSLLSIKYRKVSVHESTSRSCIPSLHSESSFPRHLRGQALFPLHSNVSFFMSFSLARLLKIAALLSPNLLPHLFSLITLSNLYYGSCIHIFTVCVSVLSHVRLLTTPWTVANLVPLSLGFPKQEYWSGLPFPSLGDLSHPGTKPTPPASPVSPTL